MCLRRLCALVLCLALISLAGAANLPRQSPEFAISMSDGKQVLLSQFRGKVVVVAFILTYCPHCQKTIGILEKVQAEYGPRGVQVLGSAIEDMAKMNVPDFNKKFLPPFPVGYNIQATVNEYLQHPAMLNLMMPNLVFIDRQGVIRSQYAGDDPFINSDDQEKHIREEIEKLLKPVTTTSTTHRKSTTVGAAAK